MLISMPTGTSAILGAFQAIVALLADRTISVPLVINKLARREKFASEIFVHKPAHALVAAQN